MSKIINPFKIEQEENDLLKQLIVLQKQNNELLQKLIKSQSTDTPAELIKRYYPDSKPINKIFTYTAVIALDNTAIGTPYNPLVIYAEERFPTRIWFTKIKLDTLNITTLNDMLNHGIRIIKAGEFIPEPNYAPYDHTYAYRNYFHITDAHNIEIEFVPPLEIKPLEQYGMEIYKPATTVAWRLQVWYVREA